MTFRDLWRRDGKISVGLKNGGGLKTKKGNQTHYIILNTLSIGD
jgi:hypothetical protein